MSNARRQDLSSAQFELFQRVKGMSDWQARLVLGFVNSLFKPEADTPAAMKVAA